jgi:hypothetical protein
MDVIWYALATVDVHIKYLCKFWLDGKAGLVYMGFREVRFRGLNGKSIDNTFLG